MTAQKQESTSYGRVDIQLEMWVDMGQWVKYRDAMEQSKF